jgi:hypothetical protein
LHRGEYQSEEYAHDRDHNEQFDKREPRPFAVAHGNLGRGLDQSTPSQLSAFSATLAYSTGSLHHFKILRLNRQDCVAARCHSIYFRRHFDIVVMLSAVSFEGHERFERSDR